MYVSMFLEAGPFAVIPVVLIGVAVIISYICCINILFSERTSSPLKPVGAVIAFLLAIFGIYNWPESNEYYTINPIFYIFSPMLCAPLVVAGFKYFFAWVSPKKK